MDSEGFVAEGSVMNIGIITHEGELVVPPFEQTLAGVTLQRLLHLLREVRCPCSIWRECMQTGAQNGGELPMG